MNYLKVFGLIASALAALLAFAGGASATTLTSPAGTVYTGTVKVVSEGEITIENPVGKFPCLWSQEGKVDQHGSTATARVPIASTVLTFCTNATFPTIVSQGALEIHTDAETADGNGRVTLVGFGVTVNRLGIICTYETGAGVDIGTLTGSKTTGSNATIEVAGAAIPKTGGGLLCGETATMSGSFSVASPSYLDVD